MDQTRRGTGAMWQRMCGDTDGDPWKTWGTVRAAKGLPPPGADLRPSFIQSRLPSKMSSHKRNFQCFNAVGGEGSHKSSHPFKHHTSRLPRIPQHGMVAPLEECYLCSEYRHAQALEALETPVTPLCHTHTPYHHHHPHQYVLTGPTRPAEHPVAHSGHNRLIPHHRYNKKVVLVKNSDPSFRRTIVLYRRSLRSFGLFLEEVSELMQYHIRKFYTLEGRKIDNVQSLMQCPSVLVCVGREPSHPSIVENFRKTSDDKLPKLSARSRSSRCNEGHEGTRNVNQGLPTKRNVINPKLESDNRSARQSVSSDKSLPDEADSPDNVDSCLHTGDGMRDDDVEKRVRVNKDGSLSMEMKVRFRLQNDETLHWSTQVRKTTGPECEYLQGQRKPYFAQVSDRSYSESENISAGEQDEAYITRRYQRHIEEPHCPNCCRHCQDYDIWKNVPGTHGASRRILTSSSSASSHTMVSRKTVVERQTMSRSSEDHIEQVVERETCVKQTENIEYCTIRSCSPNCKVQSSILDNCEDKPRPKLKKKVSYKEIDQVPCLSNQMPLADQISLKKYRIQSLKM
ncbi:retinitis pigmentosa 1-like 1 protein [Enoplosus armatus]|uniref:retinitis pigmentosa 1-like 1 protein n=1 Tax=Enoplosus armatus TaxID=215367 RepID=UPI003990EF27